MEIHNPCRAWCYNADREREYCDSYLPANGSYSEHVHTENGITQAEFRARLEAFKAASKA